jgi:hypothetical protein
MINMYSYLLKKATKKASATKKIADASPMAGFRQLFRRLSGLVSLPLLRQFPFSEPLLAPQRFRKWGEPQAVAAGGNRRE